MGWQIERRSFLQEGGRYRVDGIIGIRDRMGFEQMVPDHRQEQTPRSLVAPIIEGIP